LISGNQQEKYYCERSCYKERRKPGKGKGVHRYVGTVRCDGWGREFVVHHEPTSVDYRLAEKQAVWLEKVLANDHENYKQHPDRIELPN
jgi:hypothetical protein